MKSSNLAWTTLALLSLSMFILPPSASAEPCVGQLCVEDGPGVCYDDECVYYCSAGVNQGSTIAYVYVYPVVNGNDVAGCVGVEVYECPNGDVRVGAFVDDGTNPDHDLYCDAGSGGSTPSVQSCAVATGSGTGVVIVNGASMTQVCYDPAPCGPGQIGTDLGTIYNQNKPGCVNDPNTTPCPSTTSPGPGWEVGFGGTCVGMVWVEVNTNVGFCTVEILVYNGAGTQIFRVCQ